MEMRVKKNAGKPPVILYRRNDGTETWMQADDFFVRHDLCHYAIEKTLGYNTAFMGMLNNGMDIKDFENREKRKLLTITKEAWYAENIANLFLIEIAQGNFDNFNRVAATAFANCAPGLPLPELSADSMDVIRRFLRKLLASWDGLPAGETMLLTF
jgi:hypothetical protein